MDALKNIIGNVPTWLTRLDDLTDEIDKRQLELAKFAEEEKPAAAKAIRHRGSTESLKPKDEVVDHPLPAPTESLPTTQGHNTLLDLQTNTNVPATPATEAEPLSQPKDSADEPSSPISTSSNNPAHVRKQSQQVIAVARAHARADVLRTMKKTTSSTPSNEASAALPKYRTRSMIIVYYDSYVQSFFEELVKFVSGSRNLMRKAKMAAKVAQIRRMAERELPDDDGAESKKDGGVDNDTILTSAPLLAADPATDGPDEPLQTLRYMSSRRMGPISRTPGLNPRSYGRGIGGLGSFDKPDIYDDLDKALESVQSVAEHGAHQFLRDGSCSDEIQNIRKKLDVTRGIANKEMERIKVEEPEQLEKMVGGEVRPRSRAYKATIMRKTREKESVPVVAAATGKVVGGEVVSAPVLEVAAMEVAPSKAPVDAAPEVTMEDQKLEVDDDDDGDDDNDGMVEVPKLVFRSTRHMRMRNPQAA